MSASRTPLRVGIAGLGAVGKKIAQALDDGGIPGMTLSAIAVRDEARDIRSYELGRPDGAPLPAFSAGSHIDVHVPGGPVRQYSLCNDAGESHRYRIAVLRDAKTRGGSAGMHDAVKEGDLLTISEPRNHFPLVHAKRTVLLSGGIAKA